VRPRFTAFVWSPGKVRWIRENYRCGDLYTAEPVQGQQKLNDGFGKMIHPETIDRDVTVEGKICYGYIYLHIQSLVNKTASSLDR
jgi:hypothetical protein